jgi:hypothetical protein
MPAQLGLKQGSKKQGETMKSFWSKTIAALRGAVLACVVLTLTAPMTACGQQKTVAAYIDAVGILAVSYATAKGDTADAQNVTRVYQAAAALASAWTPGTPDQEVIQAVKGLQTAILPLLDLDAQDSVNTNELINDVVGILELLPGGNAATVTPAFQAHVAAVRVTTAPAPKNAKAAKKNWNAALVQHPVVGLAPVK